MDKFEQWLSDAVMENISERIKELELIYKDDTLEIMKIIKKEFNFCADVSIIDD